MEHSRFHNLHPSRTQFNLLEKSATAASNGSEGKDIKYRLLHNAYGMLQSAYTIQRHRTSIMHEKPTAQLHEHRNLCVSPKSTTLGV